MEDLNILHNFAWSFHRSTGIDKEELFSEAAIAYFEAKNNFDESKGLKFSTYIWNCIRNHLVNFCKREQRRFQTIVLPPEAIGLTQRSGKKESTPELFKEPKSREPSPFDVAAIHEFIDQLPDNLKEIAEKLIDNRIQYMNMPPKLARGQLKRQLTEAGWSVAQIWGGFTEMRETITEKM